MQYPAICFPVVPVPRWSSSRDPSTVTDGQNQQLAGRHCILQLQTLPAMVVWPSFHRGQILQPRRPCLPWTRMCRSLPPNHPRLVRRSFSVELGRQQLHPRRSLRIRVDLHPGLVHCRCHRLIEDLITVITRTKMGRYRRRSKMLTRRIITSQCSWSWPGKIV